MLGRQWQSDLGRRGWRWHGLDERHHDEPWGTLIEHLIRTRELHELFRAQVELVEHYIRTRELAELFKSVELVEHLIRTCELYELFKPVEHRKQLEQLSRVEFFEQQYQQ